MVKCYVVFFFFEIFTWPVASVAILAPNHFNIINATKRSLRERSLCLRSAPTFQGVL